jgi:hypothetical protein
MGAFSTVAESGLFGRTFCTFVLKAGLTSWSMLAVVSVRA